MLPKRTDGVSFSALLCTEKLKHTCGAIIIPPSTCIFSPAVPLQIKISLGVLASVAAPVTKAA